MAGSEGRKQNQLTVGVLLFPTVQFLDVSAVDLFCMFDPSYLGVGLPAHIVSLGTPVKVKYIAASGKGSLISTTAGASIEVTDSLVDESVKPGNLDILVIPGPEPSYQLADPEKVFIQAHAKVERSVIMTVCSGILAAVQAGILDGRQATGPRALLSQLALQCPKAKWVDKRWTCDIAKEGERRPDIWSSGGITNGQDMVAAYVKQIWPGTVSNIVCAIADVGDRGQDYSVGKLQDNSWWIWQILRAFLPWA